jgi:threonine 3-dehydrogenase
MPETMKALVKYPRVGLSLEEVPRPSPGPNDVLIQVDRTGICGTDLHIWNWDAWAQATIPVPMVIGHEFVGVITELGENVTEYRVGEVVSGEGHIVCGHCRNCRAGRYHLCEHTMGLGVDRPGAFAQYVIVPKQNVWVHHPGIDPDVMAIFDPYGNATHTALTYDVLGEDVLITGAGPIGAMACAICRYAGARHVVVTDINPYRLELAAGLGATRAVNVADTSLSQVMHELGMVEGFDVGLEMSGAATALGGMLESLRNGGNIALLGIPSSQLHMDWKHVIFKGLNLLGIYGRKMYETWYKMSAMLEGGLDISGVITHRFPYTDFEQGFKVMADGHCGKVILRWSDAIDQSTD